MPARPLGHAPTCVCKRLLSPHISTFDSSSFAGASTCTHLTSVDSCNMHDLCISTVQGHCMERDPRVPQEEATEA